MKDEFDDLFGEYEKEFEDGEKQEEGKEGEKEGEEREENKQAKEDELGDLSELSKMMGVKPKNAAIISGLDKISLCSMCTLCEIPADCFDANHGSFAVLNVKDRDPEEDARILTQTFRGLEVVLIVNRDQNLSAKVYKEGKEKEKVAPPIILFEFPALKNYLVGISNLSELKGEGTSVNSLSLTKEEALTLLKQIF
ncbi:MAG: hypothetical protein J6P06_02800 [Aeriscardovia sp.]|nr:hypothetical protein [Aeriscardovia sp.]MBO6019373.1 hypothetical protein [Aeriscardovia sp.]